MKKQKINVSLGLIHGGTNQLADAASVYDQLLAHQDIVYNFIPEEGSEGEPYKAIYPYHAVNFAVISREVETVAAPTDSVCKEA